CGGAAASSQRGILPGALGHPALVQEAPAEPVAAQPPDDAEGRPAGAAGQTAVLSALMVEAAERDAIRRLVAAAPGAVHKMVVLQVAARGAAGSGAAPAV